MNSNDNMSSLKYFSKIAFILVIVFLILKYVINLKPYEAVLLSCIIAVSILIIENIFYINSQVTDPLNCDECIIQKVEPKTKENFAGNINNQMSQEKQLQDLVNKSKDEVVKMIMAKPELVPSQPTQSTQSVEPSQPVQPMEEPKPVDNLGTVPPMNKSMNNSMTSGQEENLDSYIDEQNKMNNELVQTNMKEEKKEYKKFSITDDSLPGVNDLVNKSEQQSQSVQPTQSKNMVPTSNNIGPVLNEKTMNLNDPVLNIGTFGGVPGPEASFDVGYVKYQKDGLQAIDEKISEKTNIFRASIGNPEVVQEYLKDGKKYYDQIYSYSTDAPTSYEAQGSEMKYGNYNYIGPLNKGMINKAYTFVSPTNWYPIPPVPPVCVTNKNCITSPVLISDGKDYMNYANLEDFDNARRFTGDMGINIDYIKNVLNNPNAY